jgi:hypothetical protein
MRATTWSLVTHETWVRGRVGGWVRVRVRVRGFRVRGRGVRVRVRVVRVVRWGCVRVRWGWVWAQRLFGRVRGPVRAERLFGRPRAPRTRHSPSVRIAKKSQQATFSKTSASPLNSPQKSPCPSVSGRSRGRRLRPRRRGCRFSKLPTVAGDRQTADPIANNLRCRPDLSARQVHAETQSVELSEQSLLRAFRRRQPEGAGGRMPAHNYCDAECRYWPMTSLRHRKLTPHCGCGATKFWCAFCWA